MEAIIEEAKKIVKDKIKSENETNADANRQVDENLNANDLNTPSSKNGGKSEFETVLSTLLKSILSSTIAIHRYELRGSIELMVGGRYSSTPWHLTIGNPYSPWISTNHIVIESCEIETGTEMGFNDMPQNITATFNCRFSRALGKQELMRMFNNSYRRTYSNYPVSDIEEEEENTKIEPWMTDSKYLQ
jgi:hypothetical protein